MNNNYEAFFHYDNISITNSTESNKLYNDENYGLGENKKCNCLPACSSIQYEAEISQTSLNMPAFYKAEGDRRYFSPKDKFL